MVYGTAQANGAHSLCELRAFVFVAMMLSAGGAVAQPHVAPTALSDTAAKPVVEPAEIAEWLRRLAGRYRFEGAVEVVYPGYGCVPVPPDPTGERPPDPFAEDPPPDQTVPYCRSIKGMGDCVGIGTGPGVQCVLNVTWDDLHEVSYPDPDEPDKEVGVFNLPGGVSYLDPSMALYGVDPGKAAISYLLVDSKGLPEGAPGFIAGNRATLKTNCVNAPVLLAGMKPPPVPAAPPLFRTTARTCERTIRIDAKPDAKIVFMSIDFEINDEVWTRITMSMHRVMQTVEGVPPAKPSASR